MLKNQLNFHSLIKFDLHKGAKSQVMVLVLLRRETSSDSVDHPMLWRCLYQKHLPKNSTSFSFSIPKFQYSERSPWLEQSFTKFHHNKLRSPP